MELRLVAWQLGIRVVPTRLPFRFGVVTVTALPEATLEVTVEDRSGRRHVGYAADFLSIRWFDRRTEKTPADNVADLIAAVQAAARLATDATAARLTTPFDLWWETLPAVRASVLTAGGNGLIAGFGASMVERAVLDAAARLAALPIDRFLAAGLSGFDGRRMHPTTAAADVDALLRPLPDRIMVRHTVGYLDPLTDADLDMDANPGDGEPVTLAQYLTRHRPRYLKIIITGKPSADADRLARIAAVIADAPHAIRVTLDGGEQYSEPAALAELFAILRQDRTPAVRSFLASLLWLEQPVTREQSLDPALMAATTDACGDLPLVLDEGEDGPDVFATAMKIGWRGVSHKNCKGVYKSLANAALMRAANAASGGERYFLTGEDLSTMPVTALHADTVIAAALGLTHIQRNGHHFFRAGAALSQRELAGLLARHPDLYAPSGGGMRLRISEGAMAIGSLNCPGMGFAVSPDMAAMTPAENWSFDDLAAAGAATVADRAQCIPSKP